MSAHSNNHSSSAFVNKLVCHILRQPSEKVKQQYRNALRLLNTSFASYACDESTVVDNIRKRFTSENKEADARTISELHRKLQISTVLKNRLSVLQFLYCLYGTGKDENVIGDGESFKRALCENNLELKTHDIIDKHCNKTLPNTHDFGILLKNHCYEKSESRGANKSANLKEGFETVQSKAARLKTLLPSNSDCQLLGKYDPVIIKAMTTRSEDSNLGSLCSTVPNLKLLLHDLLYAMQGLRGEILHWEPEKNNFNVTFREDFPNPIKRFILRFMELGWMYCKINNFCKSQKKHSHTGLIVQSLVAALKIKLIDYYKLIAELEAMLTQEMTLESLTTLSNSLTLHKLSVYLLEPHVQLKILGSVVDACVGKKGGALLTILYAHLQHGDPYIRSLMENLLQDVSRPFFKILSNWIYCGELDDIFEEFFISANNSVLDTDLWQQKYHLNKAMIPSFITTEQARKILSTGKSINFLHHVCQDNTFVRDESRRIKALELMNTDSLFLQDKDSNFENILEKNYIKTSRVVLKVLYDDYHLMDHIVAMRNYFLLWQGDFIRHLMDLLDADLSKPVNSLQIHNLSPFLESAIRATNAQFHQPDVLQRLDFSMLENSIAETGWELVTFKYHIDGPLSTIFFYDSMRKYQRIFLSLWKAKRMEYVLGKISHSRTFFLKLQSKVPEVSAIMYLCHSILAQMVHFILQMQYYMAFEVMECCWAELRQKIASAQDLDEVVSAHSIFLKTFITRALFDECPELLENLNSIYDVILDFDKVQCHFWASVKFAVEKLNAMNELIQMNTNSSCWGLTDSQRIEHTEPLNRLKSNVIPVTKAKLKVISATYETAVQKFLVLLNNSDDENLHYLSFRLDFNEYFKKKCVQLQTSLTYDHHRRKSTTAVK